MTDIKYIITKNKKLSLKILSNSSKLLLINSIRGIRLAVKIKKMDITSCKKIL